MIAKFPFTEEELEKTLEIMKKKAADDAGEGGQEVTRQRALDAHGPRCDRAPALDLHCKVRADARGLPRWRLPCEGVRRTAARLPWLLSCLRGCRFSANLRAPDSPAEVSLLSWEICGRAGVAQSVEHLFCKQAVRGSSPLASSNSSRSRSFRYLSNDSGGLPERPKGADCKSAGYAFGGSNPTPSTRSSKPSAQPRLRGHETNRIAGVAQLVERQPSKLNVAGSNPVSRSEVQRNVTQSRTDNCPPSSVVEHLLGKEEVVGFNPRWWAQQYTSSTRADRPVRT